MNKLPFLVFLISLLFSEVNGQLVPSLNENVPYLVNIGKNAKPGFGDDDHKQAFFFAIPASYKTPFYIRIYDPGTGGALDEQFGVLDTKTTFSFYGGDGVYSSCKGKNAPDLSENAFGDMLYSESYGSEPEYDTSWHSIGPFNPAEGEYVDAFDAYVIKVVAECVSGNDGNLYNYFVSSDPTKNTPITAVNAFTFEFTLRLNDSPNEVSHLYPYVDNKVKSIQLNSFDFDRASTSLFSRKRFSEKVSVSNDGVWGNSKHKVYEPERESCFDVRISNSVNQNDVVVSATNNYGEYLPFMSVPIGDFTFEKSFIIE